MKYIIIAATAALLLSANALAAIKIDGRQARNMDDVQSLGAKYFQPILIHEPESNGVIHASAAIYR